MDQFLFNILILSVPGSICFLLYLKIAILRRDRKHNFSFYEIMFILISSIFTLLIYDSFVSIINRFFNTNYSLVLKKFINTINYTILELIILTLIGLFLGVVLSLFENKKILYHWAKKLNITNSYGDDDVWTFICNSPDVEWIFVRDHKYNLVYFGRLEQYSDPGEIRELLLSDVSVFSNSEGSYCYDTPKMYISRSPEDLTIEILPKDGGKNGRKKRWTTKTFK